MDDNIDFLCEVEDGWWKGRLNGRVGVFPSNFVEETAPLLKHLWVIVDPHLTSVASKVLYPFVASQSHVGWFNIKSKVGQAYIGAGIPVVICWLILLSYIMILLGRKIEE